MVRLPISGQSEKQLPLKRLHPPRNMTFRSYFGTTPRKAMVFGHSEHCRAERHAGPRAVQCDVSGRFSIPGTWSSGCT